MKSMRHGMKRRRAGGRLVGRPEGSKLSFSMLPQIFQIVVSLFMTRHTERTPDFHFSLNRIQARFAGFNRNRAFKEKCGAPRIQVDLSESFDVSASRPSFILHSIPFGFACGKEHREQSATRCSQYCHCPHRNTTTTAQRKK